MPELSNLLRERLGARPLPRVHPDPDLLNAFSENALGAAERSQVAEHLSACAYCREVLAVALPETEAQPALVPAGARKRPFWRMPAFGLAATAAAVVAIGATFVLELQQRQSSGTQVAQQQEIRQPVAPANVSPSNNQDQPAPALQSPAIQDQNAPPVTASARTQLQPNGGGVSQEADRAAHQTAARAKPNAPITEAAQSSSQFIVTGADAADTQIGPPKRDYVNEQMFSQAGYVDSVAAAPAAAPQGFSQQQTPPAAFQTFLINGQNNAPIGIPANAIEPSKALKPIGPVPSQRPSLMAFIGGTGVKVGKIPGKIPSKIGPAISGTIALGMHSTVFGNALQNQSAEAVPAAPPPASGSTLLSTDGFTALALSAPHSAAAPDALHWKISGSTLMKSADAAQWQDAFEASVPLTFVVSHGSDVWAGGAQGKLVHSSDRGQHWEEFQPDQSASGNVLSIELAGNTVTAKTSTNQIWSSQDGGKSWVRVTPQE